MTVITEQFHCSDPNPQVFPSYILPAEEGEAWLVPGNQLRLTHHTGFK